MIFFALLIAFLLEQVRPMAHDGPVHTLLRAWTHWVQRSLDAGQPAHGWLAWALAACLPALLVSLVFWGLHGFSTILSFIWLVAVLYAMVGFRQFSHHFTDIRQALEAGDDALARKRLADWLQVDAGSLPRTELLRQVLEQSILAAHRHVFGVLACFVVLWVLGLGPFGAVLYRMAEYLARAWRHGAPGSASPALEHAAATAWQGIDWLPARATALGFAVVGNFEEAVAGWREASEQDRTAPEGILLAATSGALGVRLAPPLRGAPAEPGALADDPPQTAHLASAVGLVWRSVVLWMLLLALLSLARLLG